jgi:hypothetical protein
VNNTARYIVAGALLAFAWRGGSLDVKWPLLPQTTVVAGKPADDQIKWAGELKTILPRMLPADREYLSNFYDAMEYILKQDGERSTPIIGDTEKFTVFHAGSLNLAIQKKNVGKYPGLDKAIDAVFFSAAGADTAMVDAVKRQQLMDACGVLRWSFKVNGNE